MKAVILVIIVTVMLLSSSMQAQVTITIGSPPLWGPVGYTEVHYYYLPDVEAYYDVQSSMFIYYNRGVWVHRAHLPYQYRNYDLYGGYKVVMSDYHGNSPYTHFKEHKVKYSKGYRGPSQKNIGERPEQKNHRTNSFSNGSSNKRAEGHNKNGNSKKNHANGGGKGKRK